MDSQKGIDTRAHKCTHASPSLPLSFSHCPPPPRQAHSHTHAHGRTWTSTLLRHSPREAGEHMLSASRIPKTSSFPRHLCPRGCWNSYQGVFTLIVPENLEQVGGSSHPQGGNEPLSTWGCNADEFHIFIRDFSSGGREG